MHSTRTPFTHDRAVADEGVESRLNWLLDANQWEANRQRLFRNAREEEEILLMRSPIPAREAFAFFGLLLGTLPPAAIFIKLFGYGISFRYRDSLVILLLCLAMNVVCGLVGRGMGSVLGRQIDNLERSSWIKLILLSPLMGLAWAIPTGAAGGAVAFIFGGLYGAILAMPVGLLAFVLFMPLHRLLARGGMIDARHLWPLACGVVMVITALILGL